MQNIPQYPQPPKETLMKLVTLIIPTYNRPDFLKRLLNYYNSFRFENRIIIADSSKPLNKKLNKKVIRFFPSLDILYLDNFPPTLVSHHKFAKIVEKVKTKYCVFCADDDFITPNGIKEAVYFLEHHPDYSCAHGSYISFYVHTNLIGKKELWWNFIYPFKSITETQAEKRLESHLLHYEQVLYSVRRTDITQKCYRKFVKFNVSPVFFGELLPDILMLIYGKMKRIHSFYAARQAFSSASGYWPTLKDAIAQGIYDREYQKFTNCLISALKEASSTTKEQRREIIDKNMNIYLKSTTQQHFLGKINLVLKHLPLLISDRIRLLHIWYLFSKEKKDNIGLIDNPSSVFFKDFDRIRQIALNYSD